MSAINNFTLFGYCKEQRKLQYNGVETRNVLVVDVNVETAKGTFVNAFEITLPTCLNQYRYEKKDVAISGYLTIFRGKTGIPNVRLIASNCKVLAPGKAQTSDSSDFPIPPSSRFSTPTKEEKTDIDLVADDLPF